MLRINGTDSSYSFQSGVMTFSNSVIRIGNTTYQGPSTVQRRMPNGSIQITHEPATLTVNSLNGHEDYALGLFQQHVANMANDGSNVVEHIRKAVRLLNLTGVDESDQGLKNAAIKVQIEVAKQAIAATKRAGVVSVDAGVRDIAVNEAGAHMYRAILDLMHTAMEKGAYLEALLLLSSLSNSDIKSTLYLEVAQSCLEKDEIRLMVRALNGCYPGTGGEIAFLVMALDQEKSDLDVRLSEFMEQITRKLGIAAAKGCLSDITDASAQAKALVQLCKLVVGTLSSEAKARALNVYHEDAQERAQLVFRECRQILRSIPPSEKSKRDDGAKSVVDAMLAAQQYSCAMEAIPWIDYSGKRDDYYKKIAKVYADGNRFDEWRATVAKIDYSGKRDDLAKEYARTCMHKEPVEYALDWIQAANFSDDQNRQLATNAVVEANESNADCARKFVDKAEFSTKLDRRNAEMLLGLVSSKGLEQAKTRLSQTLFSEESDKELASTAVMMAGVSKRENVIENLSSYGFSTIKDLELAKEGICISRNGGLERSIQLIKAIDYSGKRDDLYKELGNLLADRKDFETARTVFMRIDYSGKRDTQLLSLIDRLQASGQKDLALKCASDINYSSKRKKAIQSIQGWS
ncbi:MAG: hypothetical protein KDK78_06230 [Chlamydiia bacterium]|nr:hypothetical protein [Chlamydiia bacterium]